MENKKLYLAYGSNLNLSQMAKRCPNAKAIGTSIMKGWRLRFRGEHEAAVATVEPSKAGEVPIIVWEITTACEAALDRYEGYPSLYRKGTLRVELNGKPIQGMIYILNEGQPLSQPSCYYYSVILDGYKAQGFDVGILKKATLDSIEDARPHHG